MDESESKPVKRRSTSATKRARPKVTGGAAPKPKASDERPTTRLGVYQLVNERLIAKGWHRGPWWEDVAASMLQRHDTIDRCVSGGRRSGKSSFACRLAVAELLSGLWGIAHPVSPGDIGTISIVSARGNQARDRVSTIKTALQTLGIEHRPHYDSIDLVDAPYRVQAYAANAQGVVSQSSICVILDEVARWKQQKADAMSGEEVITSIKPTLANDPDGILLAISSPFVEGDLHDNLYEELRPIGLGFHCPTWVGNPTLDEATCRQLCTRGAYFDEAKFNREYAAIPMTTDEQRFFDLAAIEGALI